MPRFFNNAGPIKPERHYHVPLLERVDWPEIQKLIDEERYFVLHAPRQTGKTSTLLAVMETLNRAGDYVALYVNIEAAQAARHDVEAGIATVCSALVSEAEYYLGKHELRTWLRQEGAQVPAHDRLRHLLGHWASHTDKPIVLMLDEVDALVGDTLISLLRQIRAGYARRPKGFPQSVILCGVRDVRDYRIHTSHQEIITGGSAFNIKAESLRMGNFSIEDVKALYRQHTDETGQVFDPAIFDELWADTEGQPWLVNALGYELTSKDRAARDRSQPITFEGYGAARERLIQSRATHLDQLADKLKERRVKRVIEPILRGEENVHSLNPEDVLYVQDLGLINRQCNGEIDIANRIYREVIPRELSWGSQMAILQKQDWYLSAERRLDMEKLLAAFQQFFREHSDVWLQRFDYREAGPHLLLQAFLQRIVNGGGRVNREYGLGRRRTDLLVEWPLDSERGFFGPVQRVVIELKLQHKGLEKTLAEGLVQTDDYADRAKADEAHLIIFNRDAKTSWEDKIWHRQETWQNRAIDVWGA
ncbi:MAG: AAA-like domain-containing protein [Exilibacterium sp.]